MTSLPFSDTPANFLVAGGIGSGKSIALRLLMQSALSPIGHGLDHRALVYDAKGTLAPILHAMGLHCPIHVLNPFDRRGAAWDIAADVTSPSTARQLAASLIPQEESAQPFFGDAARDLLSAICLSFTKTAPGKWTLRDLLLAIRTRGRLLSLLARASETTPAARSCLDNEQTCTSILATLVTKLHPFEVIAACWQGATNKLSLARWLREEGVILRGTFVELDSKHHILYTKASTEFYMVYPGWYVPRPVELFCEDTQTTPRKLAEEILALTKMNWNNTQFDNSMPITIRAARQVGAILKHLDRASTTPTSYAYYM